MDVATLINWAFPYAQHYLYKLYPEAYIYLKHCASDILVQLQVIAVETLFYQYAIKGHLTANRKRHECSWLLQENIFYTTPNVHTHSMFLELYHVSKQSIVESRVKKLVYFCLEAVHHNRDLMKDQLLMPSKYSSMPAVILLQTVGTLTSPDLPWACKVVNHLLQRKVYFMLRGILLIGLHDPKALEAFGSISSFENVLVLISSHIGQHPCICSSVDMQWSFSSQLLSIPFFWCHLPYFKEGFFSKGLVKHYVHQMASCLLSHVNGLPDESHEFPGYACLLGNLLEAAGVAL